MLARIKFRGFGRLLYGKRLSLELRGVVYKRPDIHVEVKHVVFKDRDLWWSIAQIEK